MPTIYDILPVLQKKICELLKEFMVADNGAFYTWEYAIFLPATNAYIHYLAGINFCHRRLLLITQEIESEGIGDLLKIGVGENLHKSVRTSPYGCYCCFQEEMPSLAKKNYIVFPISI